MSLSLISEAYFVDSDSETGGGEDHDEEGDGNEHEIKFEAEAPVPDVENVKQGSFPPEGKLSPECNLEELDFKKEQPSCDSGNEDDKKLQITDSSLSLITLASDDASGTNGSSEGTEVVVEETETNRQFPNVPVEIRASSSSSDELFTRVISRRKKKKRFGDWMWSYRKRQQGGRTWNPTRGKIKRNGQFHEIDVDSVDELISASESGTDSALPSPLPLSSPKQKLEVFKCPYCLETVLERQELIKHLEIHQIDNSQGKMVNHQPPAPNAPSHSGIRRGKPTLQKREKSCMKSTRNNCKKCGTSFSWRNHLVHHKKLHSNIGRPWTCSNDKCDCAFPTKNSLRQHESRVHNMERGNGTMPCQICGRAYSTRHFTDHMRIHEEQDRLYKCSQCPSFFNTENHLRLHENKIHNRKPGLSRFPCNICGKNFPRRRLTAHLKLHEKKGRPWNCSTCDYHFPTKNHLQYHSNIAHGRSTKSKTGGNNHNQKQTETSNSISNFTNLLPNHAIRKDVDNDRNQNREGKLVKCLICKAKHSPTNLRAHMSKIHTDGPNKGWKCPQCPSFFIRFSSLSHHGIRVHGNKIGPIPCPLCKQKFKQRQSIFEHLRNMHGYTRTNARLKLLQISNPEPKHDHIIQLETALSRMRPCKIELTRCDHIISQFTRSTLPTVSDGIENGRISRNKAKFQIGKNVTKLALTNKSAGDSTDEIANDIVSNFDTTSIQDPPEIVGDINQSNFKGSGITEGKNSPRGKMIYPCPYCFEAFGEPTLLIGHLPLHTKLKKEQIGGETRLETQSTQKMEGNRHGEISSIKKPRKEAAPSSGKAALKGAMPSKKYQCNQCSYSCIAVQTLDNHMKLHSEEGRPFQCRQCTANFKTFLSLRTHEGRFHKETKDLHQVAPAHNCRLCSYSNKSLRSLMRHMKHHKDEGRDFKCHRCLYTFKSFQGLRLHESRSHKGLKSYAVASTPLRKCTECKYSTRTKQEWKNHVIRILKDKNGWPQKRERRLGDGIKEGQARGRSFTTRRSASFVLVIELIQFDNHFEIQITAM